MMNDIKNNISFNIYEPETVLKYINAPHKKSILTRIIKNPEIAPAKKQIKIKLNNIKESSIHLKEFNIFNKKTEKLFNKLSNQKTEEEEVEDNNTVNNNTKNGKNYEKSRTQKFLVINRKILEKLNIKIQNNLYDYIHPHEYRIYSKNKKIFNNHYLTMELNKIKTEKNLQKNNDIKILNLNNDEPKEEMKFSTHKSTNIFLPLNKNLKTLPNKKNSINIKLFKDPKNIH